MRDERIIKEMNEQEGFEELEFPTTNLIANGGLLKSIGKEDMINDVTEEHEEEKQEMTDSINFASRMNENKLESVLSCSAFKPHQPDLMVP